MGQVDPNKDFLLEYMASFCDKIPTDAETQDWCLCDRTAKQHMMVWLWLGKAASWAGIFGCANVVQDALVWASQIYGLNPQFSSEAEHRVAQLHSLHSMWINCWSLSYASTIRWRAQTYIIDAGGFPIVGFTLRLGQQLKVDCTELLLATAWSDFKKHLGHGTFLSSSTGKCCGLFSPSLTTCKSKLNMILTK